MSTLYAPSIQSVVHRFLPGGNTHTCFCCFFCLAMENVNPFHARQFRTKLPKRQKGFLRRKNQQATCMEKCGCCTLCNRTPFAATMICTRILLSSSSSSVRTGGRTCVRSFRHVVWRQLKCHNHKHVVHRNNNSAPATSGKWTPSGAYLEEKIT